MGGIKALIRRITNLMFLAAGALCIIYYFICGFATTFGQSMLWVWPAAGAVLIARFGIVQISIKRGQPLPYPGWVVTAARFAFVILLAVFIAIECFVATGFENDCPAGVDYVIILGAKTGSVTIEARMDRALEYLESNPDTMVVVTGGKGADETMSEGEYMRMGLIQRGIDDSRIIVENRSTSTAENLEYSRNLIGDRNASVAVVSNDYHVFRAMGIARNYFGGEVYGLPMKSNPISLPHYMFREFFTVTVDFLRGNIAY